jgi:hypothetical protein
LRTFLAVAVLLGVDQAPAHAPPLRIAVFEADVTPPLGTPLCDGLVLPAKSIDDKLLARGVVLFPTGKPIVLCSLDWVGVGNSGHRAFREALAIAVGTDVERVCVHCTHAHDAPGCDFDADALLAPHGLGGKLFDPVFAREAIRRTAAAASAAARTPRTATSIGVGKARVHEVASNRRVMGIDGKVKFVRFSKTSDPKVRAEPEGLIDPYVQTLAFFDGDSPVAVLTYYATHPQSHYGKGAVSCDFPGIARTMRDHSLPGVMHVHFNGAGGNVTAGKYNDGAPANRMVLAHRLADGMKRAYESLKKEPIEAGAASWNLSKARLPLSKRYSTKNLAPLIADTSLPMLDRLRAARNFVWARRCEAGETIDVQCLNVGSASVLHLPGELFVEYQLAAQRMRPDSPIMTAAYGDYGTGYIGTEEAYSQGGYETGPVSRVAPHVEPVLMSAINDLLKPPPAPPAAERRTLQPPCVSQ